jgi:mRNA interferase RelE/StbE
MKFSLVYTKRAIRDIRKLDESIKLRVGKALLRFREDPMKYAEKITDTRLGQYRFRIGDYRVVASATKNPYKIGSIRVTLSPVKQKEEVLWVRSDLIKSRSWLY